MCSRHKFHTCNTSHSWLKLNIPAVTFKLNTFKFFFNNCFVHKAIIIFKVAAGIFKVDVCWNSFAVAFSLYNLNTSVFFVLWIFQVIA